MKQSFKLKSILHSFLTFVFSVTCVRYVINFWEVAGAMSLSILKNIGEKDGKQTGNLYSSVVEPKTQKNVTITTTVYWAKTSSYVVHTHHNTYQKANKVTVTTLTKERIPAIIVYNWQSNNVTIFWYLIQPEFNEV